MTEDQFMALLLFQFPFILLFGSKCPLIIAIIMNVIVFMFLFRIAEKEFIRDCKKGYKRFEESILPYFIYKWNGDVE